MNAGGILKNVRPVSASGRAQNSRWERISRTNGLGTSWARKGIAGRNGMILVEQKMGLSYTLPGGEE